MRGRLEPGALPCGQAEHARGHVGRFCMAMAALAHRGSQSVAVLGGVLFLLLISWKVANGVGAPDTPGSFVVCLCGLHPCLAVFLAGHSRTQGA
jgi:hypothetical protein